MSFTNDIKYTTCNRCKTGKVMTGRHQEFNAKALDGTIICSECKYAEIVSTFQSSRKTRL